MTMCERVVNKRPCGNTATEFVMGQHVCPVHDTKGSDHCTHSLGFPRCSWCGAWVKESVDTSVPVVYDEGTANEGEPT